MEDRVILTQVPVSDLVKEITKAIREELGSETKATSPTEELLSRKEAAQLMHITLPTLRAHTRSGRFSAYRIGRRILYKKSELLASMKPLRFRVG